MSLKYKIAFNTIIQFLGRFLTSFLGFITTVILARYLGAYQFGVYAKIYTLAAFFFLFVDFGLNAIYVRRYKDDLKQFWHVFVLRTLFFVLSLLMIGVFFLLTGNSVFSAQEKIWVILFAPTILFFAYYTTLNIIFQLKLRYDLSVLAAIIGAVIALLLLISTLKFGFVFAIISFVIGYAITVGFAFYFAKKIAKFSLKPSAFNTPYFKGFVKEALPLGAMLFLNTVYTRVDIFILSALRGDTVVGIYQLAYKFFEFPLAFATFFANAIFPFYVMTYKEDQPRFWRTFKKATLYLVLSSIIFTAGAWLIAPYLGLIKDDYIPSAQPLKILALSYPIFFLTSAFSWLMVVQKREKSLIWVYALGFLLNIVLNFIFIPQFSYLAASWVTVISEVFILFWLVVLVWKR